MAKRTSKRKADPVGLEHVAVAEMADISWEGDTHEVLKGWPSDVRFDLGNALREMQAGRKATLDFRRMESIGEGVFELKTQDRKTWYRLIYLSRIENVIYVLDCFEKTSRKTEKKDIKTAGERLSKVKQRLMEERRDEKHNQRNQ